MAHHFYTVSSSHLWPSGIVAGKDVATGIHAPTKPYV